ncbi:gonadotropin-releasing hormone receptor [Zeugodacus cucurbitae]|uniref:gonadotropin-releasing hormone receptor n=1 Tax=Zeugodacus cucurbitae TaxID=28588 RepID=UPI0005969A61|nr:gonadotropin-releasing hormone receptor [Zeugodacus cucurbitae]XP_028895016.1 gonadotropin-releasing hormone receptor [Zeugodacus cucurbitae]
MEGESVVATSILNSHRSVEAMLEHFAENLTRTQEYYENHDANATVAVADMTTTTSPNMPLSRLAQVLITISPNLAENNTNYPFLSDILETTTASNVVYDTHAPEFSTGTLVKVWVLAVMATASLFGNMLTMWNIYKTRFKRRSLRNSWNAIYSLLFHLSIADLLVTGFCIIGEAAWAYTVQWRGGDLLCKTFKLFQMFSLYLSTYVMVLIGVDRWFAVKFPMRSLYMTKRCYQFLGIVYISSFILSIPQFFIFHLSRGPFIEEFHQCVTHGTYTAPWQEQSYTTFTLFSTFLIPFCVLTVTYISTFRAISKSEKIFLGPQQEPHTSANLMHTNRQRLIHKAKMNSLRLSFVIIIAFLICWAPYCTLMVLLQFVKIDEATSKKCIAVIFFFGMSNSLANPVIYYVFHLHSKSKSSDKGGNGGHSLNRADSQRNPSMLTAVTQIDGSGRSTRINRQPSYYRAQHNVSNNSKEQTSLLQMTPTAAIVHKFNSNSERSSVGSSPQTCSTNFTRSELGDQEHESGCEGGGGGGGKRDANSHSTVVYSFKKPAILRAKSFEALAISPPPNNRMQAPKAVPPVSENGFHRSVCVLSLEDCKICADEHVSNV